MKDKTNLEKTVEFALWGAPEIKPEEKKKWLGEFRERIIMGISLETASQAESIIHVEKALEDQQAEMLIVNNSLPSEIVTRYMQLAKKVNREYKSVDTDHTNAMGVVVASRQAVKREAVEPQIKMLPPKFKGLKSKKLCSKCYEEVSKEYPEYLAFFEKISFGDKMIGIKCGACDRDKVDGILTPD